MKTSPFALAAVLGAAGYIFVDAADISGITAGRSPPSQSLLSKSKSFLSNIMPVSQVSHLQGRGDEISRSRDDTNNKKPINLASIVTVKKDFFSKEETASIRLNENKYQRMPAVGFSGNRVWGGAYVPKTLLRRLIEDGGEQCPSEEFENNLPSGVHILTNHVTETTDPHTDYNPTTLESIENDVAIIFLNTNPDATLLVEDGDGGYATAADVEEGTLVMFPGGSVSHHIEMKEGKDGGFVHMFGPLEVGGSHGTVGFADVNVPRLWQSGPVSADYTSVDTRGDVPCWWCEDIRMLEVEGSDELDTSSSSTNQQYGSNNVAWKMVVTGFTNGTDFSGNTNTTLEVTYKFEGLGNNLNCTESGTCFNAELKDRFNNCDGVETGQLQSENDEPKDTNVSTAEGDGDERNPIILKILSYLGNMNDDGVIEGVKYINIGKAISYFFDKPVTLNRYDGKILACSIFTEVKSDSEAGASGGGGSGAVLSTSGAGKSFVGALLTITVFVSSAVVLITSL